MVLGSLTALVQVYLELEQFYVIVTLNFSGKDVGDLLVDSGSSPHLIALNKFCIISTLKISLED